MNIFDRGSSFRPIRWLIVGSIGLLFWLAYADYTGWRILTFNDQQKWSASGPGGHK